MFSISFQNTMYCNTKPFFRYQLELADANSVEFRFAKRRPYSGSPSRMRIVRRISFGITTLPKSSILLTISVAFISFHAHHTITNADMSLNILGRIRCRLQFLTKGRHKHTERCYVVIPTAAPDLLGDEGMCQYFTDVL